ncbi:MAG TPA: XRE family transcriptional regulator [Alphaproteobacteria bacterium]|nr:XRE family transcriptional regulator [Alphaproteobacteria bacterium]
MMTEIRPLRTEADYDAALKEIEQYFDQEPEPGTPAGDRFDLLALVIEDYERKHWPIEASDPIEALKLGMEMGGYKQSDFAALIGSKSRASEILNRKRHLTLEAIWKLTKKWHIPAESLIKPYPIYPGKKAARIAIRHVASAKAAAAARRAARKAAAAARKASRKPSTKRARA